MISISVWCGLWTFTALGVACGLELCCVEEIVEEDVDVDQPPVAAG